jgi:hypothetical protein
MNEIYIRTQDLAKWLVNIHFKNEDLITIDDLISKLEDTTDELGELRDEFEEFKKEVEENYKFIGDE